VKYRIASDTPLKTGDKFSIDNAGAFSVENQGSTDARIGYPGEGSPIDIPQGTTRDFVAPHSGFFTGEMEATFIGGENGKLLVTKIIGIEIEDY